LRFGGILGRFFGSFDRGFKGFTARYIGTVGSAIRRSVRSMAIFLILTGAAVWLLQVRPSGFMPDEDQGYLIGLVYPPRGRFVCNAPKPWPANSARIVPQAVGG